MTRRPTSPSTRSGLGWITSPSQQRKGYARHSFVGLDRHVCEANRRVNGSGASCLVIELGRNLDPPLDRLTQLHGVPETLARRSGVGVDGRLGILVRFVTDLRFPQEVREARTNQAQGGQRD